MIKQLTYKLSTYRFFKFYSFRLQLTLLFLSTHVNLIYLPPTKYNFHDIINIYDDTFIITFIRFSRIPTIATILSYTHLCS